MKNRGLLFAFLGFVGLILLVIAVGVSSYISNYNYGNRAEQTIKAEYESAKNTLSSTATTVVDLTKVSERYAGDVRKMVEATMSGRYGEDGSQAMMQWIQEQNIPLDASVYKDISQAIRAGRSDFKASQNRVIDTKRSYETKLGNFWSGLWLGIAGYPKIDLADYKIILDQSTQDKYETGTDSGFM